MQFKLALTALFGIAALGGLAGRVAVSAQQEPAAGTTTTTTTTTTSTTTTTAQAKTQWDGVYAEEQAKRGDALYVKACGSCHGPDLAGTDKGPPLIGAVFDKIYDGRKLGDLSERMRTTMPVDSPGSLTRAQNADLLAFMLSKAGAPAAQANLPTNVDQLNSITYAAKKPAAN